MGVKFRSAFAASGWVYGAHGICKKGALKSASEATTEDDGTDENGA